VIVICVVAGETYCAPRAFAGVAFGIAMRIVTLAAGLASAGVAASREPPEQAASSAAVAKNNGQATLANLRPFLIQPT